MQDPYAKGKASPEELKRRFARRDEDAVLVGDVIGPAGPVSYFTCELDGEEPRRSADRAVIDANGAPLKKLDLDRAEAERTQTAGLRPVMRLPAGRTYAASDSVRTTMTRRVGRFKVMCWRGGNRVRVSVRNALESVADGGYDIWVTGGLIRDMLRSVRAPEAADAIPVGDLDLAGSVPAGTFCERMSEFLGRAELPKRVNPWNGVVVVWRDPLKKDRLFEYGVLKSGAPAGDGALAFGTDLEADAGWRDLTVNTFAMDWKRGYLVDPTGRGLSDLDPLTLRPPGGPKPWPDHLFKVLFRYFKFMKRWPDAQIDALTVAVEGNFGRLKEERGAVEDAELVRMMEPFGGSAAERRECLDSLAKRVAPGCDWSGFFDHEGQAGQ